jgi:hypothetical protein
MNPLTIVANDLNRLTTELQTAIDYMIEADADYVEAEHNYVIAKARATQEATGTVMQKEAEILLITEQERYLAMEAKQLLTAAKARADVIRTRIDVARSLAALTRSEISLSGMYT